MTHNDTVQHRTYHQPDPDRMELRQADEEDGLFSVRLPIASTGEVRNEVDDEADGGADGPLSDLNPFGGRS